MKKNLIVLCAGPTSFHYNWCFGDRNYDIMIVDYGDNQHYASDAEFYLRHKGTKFHILQDIYDKIPTDYDYIFFPDDDLYFKTEDANRFFAIVDEYNLELCQPSLVGYYSLYITLHRPATILRFTNFVELIAPCFSKNALRTCVKTFKYNNSSWGIDLLWNKLLGSPKSSIAIVDDVIVVHTRPNFYGDNYKLNNVKINSCYRDVENIIKENDVDDTHITYRTIEKIQDFSITPERKIYPDIPMLNLLCKSLSKKPLLFL
jgi:hypothetical protein